MLTTDWSEMSTRITDIHDFLDEKGTLAALPGPALRLALYLGEILAAASVRAAARETTTAVRCRRRPGRRPCRGFIRTRRLDVPPEIHWCCTACNENGLIASWRGSRWDLSAVKAREPGEAEQPRASLLLTEEEYRTLRDVEILDLESECVLAAAQPVAEGIEIMGSLDYVDDLLGHVAAAANHEERPSRARILDRIYQRLEERLRGSDPEGEDPAPSSDELRTLLIETRRSLGEPPQRSRRSEKKAGKAASREKSATRRRSPRVYELEIELLDVQPRIWRRIQVPDDITLARLHDAIQIAMGWTDSHLHQFEIGETRYGIPDPDDFLEMKDERRVRLCDVSGDGEFLYEYDFGDSWRHAIRIGQVLPLEPEATYPRCVDGRRACPPEDCGGPWGYPELLAALADRRHPEHEDLLTWTGGGFDPEDFDREQVNQALASLRRRR